MWLSGYKSIIMHAGCWLKTSRLLKIKTNTYTTNIPNREQRNHQKCNNISVNFVFDESQL